MADSKLDQIRALREAKARATSQVHKAMIRDQDRDQKRFEKGWAAEREADPIVKVMREEKVTFPDAIKSLGCPVCTKRRAKQVEAQKRYRAKKKL